MDEQIKQIAMRLHGLRDALDLTVEQVAEKIGVTPEQYAAMESGEKDLSVSTLQKISTEFGVSLDELMFLLMNLCLAKNLICAHISLHAVEQVFQWKEQRLTSTNHWPQVSRTELQIRLL